MQFAQIVGLDEVKQTLVSGVKNNHVAHAQLFFSKEGGANLALALAYATFLNCENRTHESTDSCGRCASCYKFGKLIHPDLHFVFPTATTKEISKREEAVSTAFLREWRTFLTENPYANLKQWATALGAEGKQCIIPVHEGRNIIRSLSLKAFEAEYKILVIWLPELMNINAANAILKILEEPPAKTIFLLVSNSIENMLVTILSRTQLLNIRDFTNQEIETYLVQHQNLPAERAANLALLAEGNLNAALLMQGQDHNLSYEAFRDWMRLCFKPDLVGLLKEAEQFATLDKENQKSLLQYGLILLRQALIVKFAGEQLVKLPPETLAFAKNFGSVLSANNIRQLYEQLNQTLQHLERNASAKIVFYSLSLHIAQILKLKDKSE